MYSDSLFGSLAFAGQGALALFLFGVPILLFAWHVLRRPDAEGRGRVTTFWWLSISHLGPQPVWNRRYLIIAAVPCLILVAIAVYRLRPKWIRIAAVLLIAAWATLAGFKDPGYARRDKWESVGPLVNQMLQREAGVQRVWTYVFGTKQLAQMLRGHLRLADEKRFRVEVVEDASDIIEDHFWVATEEPGPDKRSWLVLLEEEGYYVGEGLEAQDSDGTKILLFPVSREPPVSKP